MKTLHLGWIITLGLFGQIALHSTSAMANEEDDDFFYDPQSEVMPDTEASMPPINNSGQPPHVSPLPDPIDEDLDWGGDDESFDDEFGESTPAQPAPRAQATRPSTSMRGQTYSSNDGDSEASESTVTSDTVTERSASPGRPQALRVAQVLIPLPQAGVNLTELLPTWQQLTQAGFRVVFTTPGGAAVQNAQGATPATLKLRQSAEFKKPVAYSSAYVTQYAGIFLPGHTGIAPEAYLKSPALLSVVSEFFDSGKPVAALAQGIWLASRARSRISGRSSLYGRRSAEPAGAARDSKLNLELRRAIGPKGRLYGEGLKFPIRDAQYLSARANSEATSLTRDLIDALKDAQPGYPDVLIYPAADAKRGIRAKIFEYRPEGEVLGDILFFPGPGRRAQDFRWAYQQWNLAGFRVVSYDAFSSNLPEWGRWLEARTRLESSRPLILASGPGGLPWLTQWSSENVRSSYPKLPGSRSVRAWLVLNPQQLPARGELPAGLPTLITDFSGGKPAKNWMATHQTSAHPQSTFLHCPKPGKFTKGKFSNGALEQESASFSANFAVRALVDGAPVEGEPQSCRVL